MMKHAALVAAFLLSGCASGVDLGAIRDRHAAELKMVIAEANMHKAVAAYEQAKADFEEY